MERVRRKLAGVNDGNRQMVDILTAVLTDGLPAVPTNSRAPSCALKRDIESLMREKDVLLQENGTPGRQPGSARPSSMRSRQPDARFDIPAEHAHKNARSELQGGEPYRRTTVSRGQGGSLRKCTSR
jgi:hypothetical protein